MFGVGGSLDGSGDDCVEQFTMGVSNIIDTNCCLQGSFKWHLWRVRGTRVKEGWYRYRIEAKPRELDNLKEGDGSKTLVTILTQATE